MMKTLNQALRTILLALAFIGTTTTATGYDFMVKGIYYNINGDNATVTYIDYSEYDNNGHTLYSTNRYNYRNKYVDDVTIPESVTYNSKAYLVTKIGSYAFANCNSLTSISIPNTVTSIGDYAFYWCNGLKDIAIPKSVVSIGEYAFSGCESITNVVIPNSVTSIGKYAFAWCYGLKGIIIGSSVNSIGYNAFGGLSPSYIVCLATMSPSSSGDVDTSAKLYVPLESVELYRTSSGWNYFTDVRGFGENYFSMPDVTTMHGDTIVIPVTMENVDEITAFQTDIYLPDGFELIKDGDDYLVELSNRKGRDHVIMANDAPDGAIRILSYSPSLKTFNGNDGELFYLTVKVPEDIEGDYQLQLGNTILTTVDEEEVHAIDALNKVTVVSYIMIMGDVNCDGIITVADVVAAARYILNYNPEPFNFDAADINGDGKISVTDVVKIAHLVLDADYDEPQLRLTLNGSGDRMGGEADRQAVAISLENDGKYTAFQMDVTLPEGMTASDFALTERAKDLGLIVKDRGNGKIRVVGYTADLKTIKGNAGALLTFDVAGEGEILVNGIKMVTPEGQTTQLNSFAIAVNNNVTSVDEVAAMTVDHVDYYNLAGQRVEYPESGVTLVVTTYVDGTRTAAKIIK